MLRPARLREALQVLRSTLADLFLALPAEALYRAQKGHCPSRRGAARSRAPSQGVPYGGPYGGRGFPQSPARACTKTHHGPTSTHTNTRARAASVHPHTAAGAQAPGGVHQIPKTVYDPDLVPTNSSPRYMFTSLTPRARPQNNSANLRHQVLVVSQHVRDPKNAPTYII